MEELDECFGDTRELFRSQQRLIKGPSSVGTNYRKLHTPNRSIVGRHIH
jgi:hypothetical protein